MVQRRRTFLTTGLAATTSLIAGCTESSDHSTDTPSSDPEPESPANDTAEADSADEATDDDEEEEPEPVVDEYVLAPVQYARDPAELDPTQYHTYHFEEDPLVERNKEQFEDLFRNYSFDRDRYRSLWEIFTDEERFSSEVFNDLEGEVLHDMTSVLGRDYALSNLRGEVNSAHATEQNHIQLNAFLHHDEIGFDDVVVFEDDHPGHNVVNVLLSDDTPGVDDPVHGWIDTVGEGFHYDIIDRSERIGTSSWSFFYDDVPLKTPIDNVELGYRDEKAVMSVTWLKTAGSPYSIDQGKAPDVYLRGGAVRTSEEFDREVMPYFLDEDFENFRETVAQAYATRKVTEDLYGVIDRSEDPEDPRPLILGVKDGLEPKTLVGPYNEDFLEVAIPYWSEEDKTLTMDVVRDAAENAGIETSGF